MTAAGYRPAGTSHAPTVDGSALLRGQGGVVTSEQLLEAGVSARQLSAPGRPLVRIRRGVYADRLAVERLPPSARVVLDVRAARLTSEVDLVAAGATAALVHGLPLLGPRPARLHLVERKQDRPQHHGASASLRAGEVLDGRSGWPGAEAARTALSFAEPGSESPLESLGRVRFVEQRLPPPSLQVLVADADGPFARVDQCWEEHWTVAEADGALTYATPADLFAEKRP